MLAGSVSSSLDQYDLLHKGTFLMIKIKKTDGKPS